MKNTIAIIFIAASLGLFFLFTNKTYQTIKVQKAEVAEYQKALNQSRDILAKRSELADKYNNFKPADLKSLEKLLPNYVDNIKLILDMNGIAKKYGMNLKSIKVNDGKLDPNVTSNQKIGPSSSSYSSIAMSFKVSASYENFVKFMRDLEQSLRIVDVTSLSFRANPDGVYDYSVSIRTYWLTK